MNSGMVKKRRRGLQNRHFVSSFPHLLHLPWNKIRLLVPTAPLTEDLSMRFASRWSYGGGVASTRSEGDCEMRTDVSRTAQATPSRREKRHPHPAAWAGRKRQSKAAAALGAVGDKRRSMASMRDLVAGGGRSSKELDKKPIWLGWSCGYSGRHRRPGPTLC